MKLKKYNGIEGVEGREPVMAVLALGRKPKTKGFPIEKDRFHIVVPREADDMREYHPAFKLFNEAAPEHRQIIHGNIVHATVKECFEWHRKKQGTPENKLHPNGMPFCVGDGVSATRWMGGAPDNFKEIQCPNDKCEFAMIEDSTKKCKPWMRFLFRVRWPKGNLPNGLFKFVTQSWNSVVNFVGFFDSLMKTAANLGIANPSLYGVPFTMTLTKGTKPSIHAKFHFITISTDIDPLEFFMKQKQLLSQIADGGKPVALIEAPENAAEVVFEDWKQISVLSNMPPEVHAPVQIQVTKKEEPAPVQIKISPKEQSSQKPAASQNDGRFELLESYRMAFQKAGKEPAFHKCLKSLRVEFGKVSAKEIDNVLLMVRNFAKGHKVDLG